MQRAGGVVEIEQDLVVKLKSHDSIIAGRRLATIQQKAQGELERSVFTDMKVVLLCKELLSLKLPSLESNQVTSNGPLPRGRAILRASEQTHFSTVVDTGFNC